jgi:MFS family permease
VAVRNALSFSNPDLRGLAALTGVEWQQALRFCDRSHLTTQLALRHAKDLPPAVAERVQADARNNCIRLKMLEDDYRAIAAAFERNGIEWVVLKGFTHWPGVESETRYRPQYDIDLYCPPDQIQPARRELTDLGYQPLAGFEGVPIDHIPAMVRPSAWVWRHDLFDIEIPASVDLHFRFWDQRTERLPCAGVDMFWQRRVWAGIDGLRFPTLALQDRAGYACLHLLRHLLRGDVKPFHVYDIARLLHAEASNETLWSLWEDHHHAGMRRVECVIFRLAETWFDCALPDAVRQGIAALPQAVHKWFDLYAASPLESQFTPNKKELWLHLALLEESSDRRAIFLQRVLPARMPPPDEAQTDASRLSVWRYSRKVAARSVHHLRLLVPACLQGVAWWWRAKDLGKPFLSYWAAASLYNLGLFIFFLLYNLYLAQIGYKEDFIGLAASIMTAGALTGSLPAGTLIQRWGVKRALLACLLAVPLICAMRAVAGQSGFLLATAFLGGFVSSIWAVIQTPAVAQLTSAESRPFGFSLIFASGISLGFLGGLLGGRLPGWVLQYSHSISPAAGMRTALLAGCAIAVLAWIPASRLKLDDRPETGPKPTLPLRSVWRFLVPAAIWHFALGCVNPFLSLYFTRRVGLSVQDFGALFGGAKVLSLVGMLSVSAYFGRVGIAIGVARTQIAAAIALACMALSPGVWTAIPAYLAFEAFVWMYEPGCFGLLANVVAPDQRARASALYFLIASASGALAAAVAGVGIAKAGYLAVLSSAAVMAIIAALVFQTLLRDTVPASRILAHSRS